MLPDLKFFTKKNKPGRKDIDSHFNRRMFLDDGPGFFHFPAPVDIMDYDQ